MPTTTNIKAVIYARFSSSAQREESIDTQVRVCTAYANEHDMTVVKVYADHAKSGRTANRPEFQKMIRDSEKHSFSAVILYTVDRFARNRLDAALYKSRLKANGVRVFYAAQQISDDPEGIMMEALMEGYAEYYSASLSRSVRAGVQQNTLNGISSSRTPFGYSKGPDRHYVINEREAEAVRIAYDRYANGDRVCDIIDDLNRRGFRRRNGEKFVENSFNRILENPNYLGELHVKDQIIKNSHPAIISQELYDRVQERKKVVRMRKAAYKADELYLLSGKVYCECGAPLIGESGRGRSGKYYYYKCSAKKRNPASCNSHGYRKNALERVILDAVAQYVLTDENIEKIAEKAIKLIEKEKSENIERQRITETLNDVTTRLNNLMKSLEGVLAGSKALEERINQLEKEKAELEQELMLIDYDEVILSKEHIIFYLSQYKNKKVDSAEYDRFLAEGILDRVYINNDSVTIIVNLSNDNTLRINGSDFEQMVHLSLQNPKQVYVSIRFRKVIITLKIPTGGR